jgi:signal transduction histidine kinase
LKISKVTMGNFRVLKKLLQYLFGKFKSSLRLQLLITFIFCIVLAFLSIYLSVLFLSNFNKQTYVLYDVGISEIESTGINMAEYIEEGMMNNHNIQQFLNEQAEYMNIKALISDLDGKVIYKSQNVLEERIDIHSIITQIRYSYRYNYNRGEEYTTFYPILLEGQKYYLVLRGYPRERIYTRNSESPLPILVGLVTFFLAFYRFTKRKMKYIKELAYGLIMISKGDLDYRVEIKSKDELGSLAENINRMAEELKRNIERERLAEKTKSELVTSVSHDLRTPLTLIMGYLNAIKDHKYQNEKELMEYINIAYSKSERLRKLIDDLFEYTKLANEGIQLNLQEIDMKELLEQLVEEYVSLCEQNQLTIVKQFSQERITAHVDVDLIIRVFDNLLSNAVKYSYKPGEIIIGLTRDGEKIIITFENQGEPFSEEESHRIFERFYRIEKSRSSVTGGSGLGLAIAESIVKLHKGKIWAVCKGETICFTVQL